MSRTGHRTPDLADVRSRRPVRWQNNIEAVESWSGYALRADGDQPRLLRYADVDQDGLPHITFGTGTIRFWFSPGWTSASLGGKGPGALGRFVEAGHWMQDASEGWWSLYLNPEGTAIYFSAHSGGEGTDFLKAPVQWQAGEWHLVTLTYSPKGTALYLDGRLAAEGGGVSLVPDEKARATYGFSWGADTSGENLAQGLLDEIATFDYAATVREIAWYFDTVVRLSRLGPLPARAGEPSSLRAILRSEIMAGLLAGGGMGLAPDHVESIGLAPRTASPEGGSPAMMMMDTNGLWLEISLATNAVLLTLHGTTPTTNFLILSRTNLDGISSASSNWVAEQYVLAADGTNTTQTLIPLNGRTSLFFTAGSGEDTDGDGLPDAYEHFVTGTDPNNPDTGNTGISDGYKDADGDGWTNLDEMRNQSDPRLFDAAPAPSGFIALAQTGSTHVSLTWNPSVGTPIEYVLQKAYGGGSFQEIARINGGTESFDDPALPPESDFNLTQYRVHARYTAGNSGWAFSSIRKSRLQAGIEVMLVSGPENRLYIVANDLPPEVRSLLFQIYQFSDGSIVFQDLSVTNLLGGYCRVPDSWFNHFLEYYVWVAPVDSDGDAGPSEDVSINTPRETYYYGTAHVPFIDCSVQIKQNLATALRSSGKTNGFDFRFDNLTNVNWYYDGELASGTYLQSANYAYAGYANAKPYYFSYVNKFHPIEENYVLRNFAYVPGEVYPPTGLEYFWIWSKLALVSPWYFFDAPHYLSGLGGTSYAPQLGTNETRWLYWGMFGDHSFVERDYIGITNGNKYIEFRPGARNTYGLPINSVVAACCNTNIMVMVPGDRFTNSATGPVNVYTYLYPEVAQPVLQTDGYFFANRSPSTSYLSYNYPPTPGDSAFSVTNTTPVLAACVGQPFGMAGWAKQRIVNGYSNKFAYLGQYFDKAFKASSNGVATTNETGILSEYGEFFPTEPGIVALTTKPDPGQGGIQGTALVHVLKIQLDVNHDGVMDLTFGGPDNTSPSRPFTFWQNNDVDHITDVDCDYFCNNCDFEQDDIRLSDFRKPGEPPHVVDHDYLGLNLQTAQYDSPAIPSARDLEDYARLWISGLSTLLGQLPASHKVKLSVSGDAEIRLFRASETNGGTRYLTDEAGAFDQMIQSKSLYVTKLTASSPVEFPGQSFVPDYFIFCGAKRGYGQIILEVLDGSEAVLASTSAYIEIKDIKEMYERYTVGDSAKAPIAPSPLLASEDLPPGPPAFRYAYDPSRDSATPYILYVHGWNMERWEKDRFAETAFKRLFWQGYQGRFGTFRWPTDDKFGGRCDREIFWDALKYPRHYDTSESNAWGSASRLLSHLTTLNSRYTNHVYVLAHSMGNVVVGEGLRLAGNSQLVNTYVATQAAVPAHCYDGAINQAGSLLTWNYDHPQLGDPPLYGPDTPNIYGNWFAGNSAAVGRRVNFYNPNDYALAADHWQWNQILKPDRGSLTGYDYRFSGTPYTDFLPRYTSGSIDDSPPYGYFLKVDALAAILLLNVNTNRYEIMAFAAESRSKAIGGLSVGTFIGNLNLATIWPSDTQEPPATQYSRHKWHSAQFRSTNMRQRGYWQALLGPDGFTLQVAP